MQIYDNNNDVIIDVMVDDDSYRFKEIMGENTLMLKFSINDYIDFPVGSWCEYKGERYMLLSPNQFVKQHSERFDYSLPLSSWQDCLKSVKFKFFTVERNEGQPDVMAGFPRLKFSLTATPEDFVRLLVDNMNFSGITGWTAGDFIESEPVTIDFNHEYCYDALVKIAGAFETEWEVQDKTISVRRVERLNQLGEHISCALEYGYRNGILGGISRKQFDSSKVINRLWIQGGDRNINFASYGNDTLLLPKGSGFEYEGRQYITDPSGSYMEAAGRTGALNEDSLDVSKIYPKRVGEVSQVIVVDDEKGFYDFTDGSIPGTLDFSQLVIPGEAMTVAFQTGQLAGMEFEASYRHAGRRFVLSPNSNNGLIYPHGTIIPAPGDKYAVFHINLPAGYISSAEEEARNEAVKYLAENSLPKFSCQWKLDGIYAKREWDSIGGLLDTGYFVRFSDPQFLPEPVDVRITSVKEYVNRPKSPEIVISNSIQGKSVASVIAQIPAQEQAADRKDNSVREFVKRRWRDTQELIDNITGMSDEFVEDLLSALAFEGLVFRAGAEALQYNFLQDDWQTVTEPDVSFNASDKCVYCQPARVKHETIKVDGQIPYWDVPAYTSSPLGPAKPYYLYLVCNKDFAAVDGRLTGSASWLVSDKKIKIDAGDGNYTLWVAFINSENEEQNRSISTMYGLSELLPGQLTVDTIVSSDGASYWNARRNQFRLGNASRYLAWNVAAGLLEITGASLTVRDTGNNVVSSIDGQTGAATFAAGNVTLGADGNVIISSNRDGNKILIDASTRSIRLVNNNGTTVGTLGFDSDYLNLAAGSKSGNDSYMSLMKTICTFQQYAGGAVTRTINISQNGFTAYTEDGTLMFDVDISGETGALVIIENNLPTSPIGLKKGQAWNNNRVRSIATG